MEIENRMLFCPIRVIRKYLSWTDQYRPQCTNSFVTTTRRKKRVSCNTILFWINHAYRSATDKNCRLVKIKEHKVRKISTSLPFRNFSPADVEGWHLVVSSTLSTFYLQDVIHRHLNTFSIGPVVAAWEVG